MEWPVRGRSHRARKEVGGRKERRRVMRKQAKERKGNFVGLKRS